MNFTHAITREPGRNFASGITTADLGDPNHALIMTQHRAYVAVLQALDLEVEVLPALPDFPDAYFVEDVAVVTPEIAIISRPGAKPRRGEAVYIEETLARYRPVTHIQAPGTLDGGDVMQIGNHFFIGISTRTNEEGAQQLGNILQEHGHTHTLVPVGGALHLKSDVSFIGRDTLLITKSFMHSPVFEQFQKIVVDQDEAYAANCLLINGRVLMPKGFPRTKSRLLETGFDLIEVETSEMRKMDGGLSCLSLRL